MIFFILTSLICLIAKAYKEFSIEVGRKLNFDCDENLREAVSVLKANSIITLRKNINQIFLNLKSTGNHEFNLDFDGNVERVNGEIIFKADYIGGFTISSYQIRQC